MPSSYIKRIAQFSNISVYASIVDSRAHTFSVVRARRTLAQYQSRDAAIRAAQRAAAGEEFVTTPNDLIIERAQSLKPSEPLEGGLDIRLLAALEASRLERETRSKARAELARVV